MATTALDVANLASQFSSGALSALGQINSAIDRVYGIQQANNAQSLAFAQQQQDWSAEQAELNRQFNSAEALKSRNWQEIMSNTAHQREVRDLMAAGLNPVLSATGGNGAAVTSGATASGVMPSGSSGQVDTSLNAAIVSLLGKQLDAMTNLASMATNAVTQSNIADKNNSVSRVIAELTAGASMYGAELASSASRYASDNSYAASRYASGLNYQSSIFGSLKSASASRYAADRSSSASRYASDNSYAGTVLSNQMQETVARIQSETSKSNANKDLIGGIIGDVLGLVGDIIRSKRKK